MLCFNDMLAVLTYIIIENCLGNLHNYSGHKKSSSDTGSDSLHFITFFFNHEQRIDLCPHGILPCLEMTELSFTFSLCRHPGKGELAL